MVSLMSRHPLYISRSLNSPPVDPSVGLVIEVEVMGNVCAGGGGGDEGRVMRKDDAQCWGGGTCDSSLCLMLRVTIPRHHNQFDMTAPSQYNTLHTKYPQKSTHQRDC